MKHRDECVACLKARRLDYQQDITWAENADEIYGFFSTDPAGHCGTHTSYQFDCLACQVERAHFWDWRAARRRYRSRTTGSPHWEDDEERRAREAEQWSFEGLDERLGIGDGSKADGGCLAVVVGLTAVVLVIGVLVTLSAAVGSPLSTWRELHFFAADPGVMPMVVLAYGSAAVLLAFGCGLAIVWRHWLFQALRPPRLSLASYGRWVAVTALLGAGVTALVALSRNRYTPDAMNGLPALDTAVGFVVLAPLFLWCAGWVFAFFHDEGSSITWDGPENLPGSITRKLTRRRAVPKRVAFGRVNEPSISPDGRLWQGAGWLIGEDCLVTFVFSKPVRRGKSELHSPHRGWSVESTRHAFSRPAMRGTRSVPLSEAWGAPMANQHPDKLKNPYEAMPVAAMSKLVSVAPSEDDLSEHLHHGFDVITAHDRFGYRFALCLEGERRIVAVEAVRETKGRGVRDADIPRLKKELLTIPWTVTFVCGELMEPSLGQ